MWPRCFFFVGIVAFFLSVASAQGGLRQENSDTVVRAKPYAKILKGIFGSLFASAAAGCLTEAIEECKDLYKNRRKLSNVAKTSWPRTRENALSAVNQELVHHENPATIAV